MVGLPIVEVVSAFFITMHSPVRSDWMIVKPRKSNAIVKLAVSTVRVEFPIYKKDTWHIGTFGRGDFIGEMGFLDSTRRSAFAIAITDTDCFVLSRVRFDEVSDQFGTDIFEGIASLLAVRLRFMNKELRALRT